MSAARTSRLVPLVLLLGVAAVNFLWMPASLLPGDPHAWREEARSILVRGELHIPTTNPAELGERGSSFAQNERNGLYYSKFGIANSLFSLPPMWLDRALGSDIAPRGQLSLLLVNLWNVALAVALAALLYRLAGLYTRRTGVRVVFVIAALYCTSLWFYQRAQGSELYQTLLFTALFPLLTGFLRALRERGPAGLGRRAWACLGAVWTVTALLLFTRVLYGLLIPLIVALTAWSATAGRPWREARGGAAPLAAALLVPPLLMLAALGIVNQAKFGAPWLTGYHQWRVDLVSPTGRLADGLWGFLFSPRFSIFTHFPLLIFALVALRQFVERHRIDAVAMLSITATFMLVLSKFPTWHGEWSYGPRYLLPMLPVLSLPFLTFADGVIERLDTWRARAWGMAALAALAYSGYLQTAVNRLPFWIYYEARSVLHVSSSFQSVDYFLYRHTALIAADLLRYRHDLDSLPFFPELKRSAPPQFVADYRRGLGAMIERGNLYWALPPGERR